MNAELKLANIPEFSGLKFPLSEEKLSELVQALRKRNDLPRTPRPEPPRFSSNVNPAVRFQNSNDSIDWMATATTDLRRCLD
jgi:hypothetical protein